MVDFYLYDAYKVMPLRNFCEFCKLSFPGFIEEPHSNDVEGFIDTIDVGETRKVSDARITSIHFPVLRYFAIFASRCLICRGNYGNLSIPDIIILCHALFRDDTFSMGAIVAKRLNLNRTKGPILEASSPHALLHTITYLLGTMRKKKNCCLLFI